MSFEQNVCWEAKSLRSWQLTLKHFFFKVVYAKLKPFKPVFPFSPDSMDQARPHYRNCWPSLVHATALWLNNGGFEMTKDEPVQNDPGKSRDITWLFCQPKISSAFNAHALCILSCFHIPATSASRFFRFFGRCHGNNSKDPVRNQQGSISFVGWYLYGVAVFFSINAV